MLNAQPQSTPMQCRHVFTDGHRCLGHCLRHQDFCYFHHTARRPVENPAARRRRSTTFTLPELEDRAAIQLALFEILQRIAANEIDPKRAGHLLFGLQIATSLLPKQDPKHQQKFVAEFTHDPELGNLAPAAEIGHDDEPSELDRLIADFDRRNAEREATPEPELELEPEQELEPEPEPEEQTLSTIQASTDSNLTPQLPQLFAKPLFTRSCTKPRRVLPNGTDHAATVLRFSHGAFGADAAPAVPRGTS